jgi:hypothetical protein
VNEGELPHLRNSLRQGPALRVTRPTTPPPRLVEGPPQADYRPPRGRSSFWKFTLSVIAAVMAIAAMAGLGYYLVSQRSQPFAQLQQQQPQQQVAQTSPAAPQAQTQQQPVQAQARPSEVQEPDPPVPNPLPDMPSDDKLLILINSSLVALNQANATGNYTVLRDMAAPAFKRANSPDRLYQVFTNLRNQNLDLSPIILFQPKLYQRPMINNKGMLRITGFFPTSPERVNFDLIFQPVRGKWRLYGIAANTQRVPPPQATPAPQPAPAPAETSTAKPAPTQAAKPATSAKKSKPPVEAQDTAPDVRDRIDNPPPAPPAEKPKQKSIWNPFGR